MDTLSFVNLIGGVNRDLGMKRIYGMVILDGITEEGRLEGYEENRLAEKTAHTRMRLFERQLSM